MAPELRKMWLGFDAKANADAMKKLALDLMHDNYKAADFNAKHGRLDAAKAHLESAEKWRVRARNHGARV